LIEFDWLKDIHQSMKLKFKTLGGQIFEMETPLESTIATVKESLVVNHQYTLEGLKLVFNGVVLSDDSTIQSCNVTEQSFLVVLGKKGNLVKKKVISQQPQEPKVETRVEPKVEETKPVDTSLVMGEDAKRILNQFLEMGFEQDQIVKCSRLAFNNPDRAAEYLMNGIPEGLEDHFKQHQNTTTAPKTTNSTSDSPLRQALGQLGPQLGHIKQAIRQNPNLLSPLLAKISQENPELMKLIQDNPTEFASILEEVDSSTTTIPQQEETVGGGSGPRVNSRGQIMVSPEEKEAIERITAMGFERMMVVQVYFACDKNEDMTLETLISMNAQDHE
jgi:UV excision repair protein RAD23